MSTKIVKPLSSLFIGFLLIAFVFKTVYPQDKQDTPGNGDRTTINSPVPCLVTSSNHVIIDVNVNGKLSGKFLFDTGTTVSFIARSEVKKLGLADHPLVKPDGSATLGILDDKPERWLVVPYIVIGNAVLTNILFFEADDVAISEYTELPTIGVIGSCALYRASVLIDYQAHQITFIDHVNLSPQETADLKVASSPYMDIGYDRNYIITALVKIRSDNAQIETPFILDTGSPLTILISKAAEPLKLDNRFHAHLFNRIQGGYSCTFSTLPEIRLGSIALQNQGIYTGNLTKTCGLSLLGTDILANYAVLIDTGSKRVYLGAHSEPAIKMHIDKTGTGAAEHPANGNLTSGISNGH